MAAFSSSVNLGPATEAVSGCEAQPERPAITEANSAAETIGFMIPLQSIFRGTMPVQADYTNNFVQYKPQLDGASAVERLCRVRPRNGPICRAINRVTKCAGFPAVQASIPQSGPAPGVFLSRRRPARTGWALDPTIDRPPRRRRAIAAALRVPTPVAGKPLPLSCRRDL